jgi:polar amino acid transport system substrate-binding protein
MKYLKTVAGACAALVLLAGCSGNNDTADNKYDLIKPGTLTMCADVPFPPFEIEDSSAPTGYTGFDVELMTDIAQKLDLELAVFDAGFDALQSGLSLRTGQCDIAASALTITEERKGNLDFSEPYYDSLQSLLTAKDSGIKSLDDLTGKKLAVQTGSSGFIYIQDKVGPDVTLLEFPGDAEMWPALQTGNADAMLFDNPVNYEHETANPKFAVVQTFDTEEQYGFAVAKGQKAELLKAVNEQLAATRADGTYDKLYAKYLGHE